MKKEFVVNRQGKDFVLYAGLLDQAHREGLKRIHTHVIQVPSDENGQLAVVHAEVETEKGSFSGIGDATPHNVGRMIAPHLIRMAETRAKARALRDAINVGTTALEELGDEEMEVTYPARAAGQRSAARPIAMVPPQPRAAEAAPNRAVGPVASASDESEHGALLATPQQISRLQKLQAALGRSTATAAEITAEQAAAQIAELVSIFNAQSRGGRQQAH